MNGNAWSDHCANDRGRSRLPASAGYSRDKFASAASGATSLFAADASWTIRDSHLPPVSSRHDGVIAPLAYDGVKVGHPRTVDLMMSWSRRGRPPLFAPGSVPSSVWTVAQY